MKPDGKLAKWLAKAKPGHCPCGNPLPEQKRERKVCSRPRCQRKYDALYHADRCHSTLLRDVVGRYAVKGKPKLVRLRLKCGHCRTMARSLAARIGARCRCATCAASAPPPEVLPEEEESPPPPADETT